MKAEDLIKELERHPAADVMVEKDGELTTINFANYIRDRAYNDVEYFVLDEIKVEEEDYSGTDGD
jgi:hypothetical protein